MPQGAHGRFLPVRAADAHLLGGLAGLVLAAGLLAAGATAAAEAPQAARIGTGQTAPDFSLRSTAGELLTLSELRGVQPLVLIFFRGVW
jgi:cytochrome oxidase Cu insertion factor (SCO1/SenC/PrrC family)